MNKLEYAICSSTDLTGLSREVNLQIQDGWEPIGGAFFGADERVFEGQTVALLFHQALKKEQRIVQKLN